LSAKSTGELVLAGLLISCVQHEGDESSNVFLLYEEMERLIACNVSTCHP